jgi:general secretion pathway protein J
VKTQRGFTLLELMVAVALLAALAAIGFRGLASVLDAEQHVRAESRRWSEAAAVMTQIGHDLSLATERPDAGAAGELFIARMGERGALPAQSGPRRVGYRVRAGTLEYLVWVAPSSAPVASAVLDHVAGLEVRALTAEGTWKSLREPQPLPRAVEVQIALAGGEHISRLFLLR